MFCDETLQKERALYRDEDDKFRPTSNGERVYSSTQPDFGRACLLTILLFIIVVGGLIAIFILHATGVFSHYHMGCLSACQPPVYTP
jgi:hypothetical protein